MSDPQVEPVTLEVRDGVGIVSLANPPANAISAAVVDGLERAWTAVQDQGLRAMVLASANPKLFCAGADIRRFSEMTQDDTRELLAKMHRLLRAWETSGVVTIAAVNGLAFGGGCEIAMACDLRLAAPKATFGQPEVKLGIIPGFGGTQRLPRLIGHARALEMNLTGDPISAEEAARLGLVNRVVGEDEDLLEVALELATRLAAQAPLAVQQIKQVSGRADVEEGMVAEQQGFLAVFASDDATEGFDAFLAKRPAKWTGS